MTGRPTPLDRRLLDVLRTPTHVMSVQVLVGGCGSGRTSRLQRLRHELGPRACQYVDLERVSTTPERCCRALIDASPFVQHGITRDMKTTGARPAFDAMLMFLMNACGPEGSPATFLLDEILELRTFESFPGLRSALAEVARALAHSRNRFIVSTRFAARARRWIEAAPERFELVPLAPLGHVDVRDTLASYLSASDADETARVVLRLSDGRPRYTRALVDGMIALGPHGGTDPISALAAALSPDGELDGRCRFSYELRLHRARGYGALKAILQVLAEEEPLTLTQIAQRLDRTAGSTKDYLSWLQDVDMLVCLRKRYSFADPLLRLWVRVYSHPEPPTEERLAREVQAYALARLQTGTGTGSGTATGTGAGTGGSTPPASGTTSGPTSGPTSGAVPSPGAPATGTSGLPAPSTAATPAAAAPAAATAAASATGASATGASPTSAAATSSAEPTAAAAAGASAGSGRPTPSSGIIEID